MNFGKPFLAIFSLICFAALVFATAGPSVTPAPTSPPAPAAPSITCTDSDYGINPFVQGKCSPDSGKTVGVDACGTATSTAVSPITAAAVAVAASTSSTYLREFYCDYSTVNGVYCNVKTISCPIGYSCSNGACVSNTAQCKKTFDPFKKEICTDSSNLAIIKQDSCSDANTLKEFVCGPNNLCTTRAVNCALGCANGACLKCVDSNNGVNPNVAGTCKTLSASYPNKCNDANYVEEYYCGGADKSNPTCQRTQVGCPLGCANGACRQCFDSDGGMKPNVAGSCKTLSATSNDVCNDAHNVEEYYCGTDNTCKRTQVLCKTGWNCVKGACVNPLAPTAGPASTQPPAAVPPAGISFAGVSLLSVLGVMVLIGVIGAMAFWFLRSQQSSHSRKKR